MRLSVALAFAVGTVFALPLHAQEGTLKTIKDQGAIVIGHRDASIPFSYYDDRQQVVGFSMDLCARIVEALRSELKLPRIDVRHQLVTSANRIPLMANGTIDIECGSTTNTVERQKQVAFSVTTFVTANRLVSRKSSRVRSLEDLRDRTVVSTAGTTNLKQILELNASRRLGMNVVSANGHSEAFLMVESGRAAAFAMDDILLAGLVATSKSPQEYVIGSEAYSVEPYGLMLRKDDPSFKRVVDGALVALFRGGEFSKIYATWFMSPIPPKGVNLNVPMSEQLRRVLASPTDSGDPAAYK